MGFPHDRFPAAVARLVLAAAVLWHLLAVLGPPQEPPPPDTAGRDFASYYYAAQVAERSGNPYDKAALDAAATEDGTRKAVHPFFYPPPFLWVVAWAPALPLALAFALWFVANELALIGTCVALVRSWRAFDPLVGPLVAVLVALSYAVKYSAELGQVNFPVLGLAVAGLAVERRRPWLAGVLVGLAAVLKISPGVLVLWWVVRRRWVPAAFAAATWAVTSVLALPLVGLGAQLAYYTQIVPRFGSGDYNGLVVKIEMFGNHSLPNLWHLYFPSATELLSGPARVLSALSAIAVVGGALLLFSRPTTDRWKLAAQGSALLVAMLLVPVYTFEHHLVFALPAMALSVIAVRRGRLSDAWIPVLALALPVLLFPLPDLRDLDLQVITVARPVLYIWVEEAKFAALLAVGFAMAALGATLFDDRSRPPAPEPAPESA